MKMYVTAYALTKGILCLNGANDTNRFYPDGYFDGYDIGKDAFENQADAQARARDMQIAKIISLERQLARVRAMDFA